MLDQYVWHFICSFSSQPDPTEPFTILEPYDQEIGELYLVQERRVTDFEASKLRKGSSGIIVFDSRKTI